MHPSAMQQRSLLSTLGSRLWRKSEPEYHQAVARAAIVGGALWFAFAPFYAAHAPDADAVLLGRWAAVAAACITVLILLSILRSPAPSRVRRVLGISHDILATSVAMYLGGEATAFFAVILAVIMLASGVRFGAGYLGYAAALSLLCFGFIHTFSAYWRANHMLSLNAVLVLTVVPAYMYGLIRSRQQARRELERRATHDSLTGLMNRAGFEQQLEELVAPGASDQVLIYLDLDRFKAVNDAAGHAAGDQLLAAVARMVQDCVRAGDICGRMGGDEFCVLLRNCPLALGTQIATRIKDRIHDFRLMWNGVKFSVGASLGVVSSGSAVDGTALLRLADAACYAAKNAGRNTIHVVDVEDSRIDTGKIRALHLER